MGQCLLAHIQLALMQVMSCSSCELGRANIIDVGDGWLNEYEQLIIDMIAQWAPTGNVDTLVFGQHQSNATRVVRDKRAHGSRWKRSALKVKLKRIMRLIVWGHANINSEHIWGCRCYNVGL